MISSFFVLIIFISMALYLILVIYSKQFWLNSIDKSLSFINSHTINTSSLAKVPSKLILVLGTLLMQFTPQNFAENLKKDLNTLNRESNELTESFGLLGITALVLIPCTIISKNPIYIILLFVIGLALVLEIKISVELHRSKLENNLDHIVKCLKILVAKAETPITTALEIINQDLSKDLSGLGREIYKIIERSKKSGIRKTLHEWETSSSKIQDFIFLLLAIHEGASKKAIHNNIDKFLNKYEEDQNERIKTEAENLQLYLILPIIVMLVVAMLPMVDAINFYMKNTGVL